MLEWLGEATASEVVIVWAVGVETVGETLELTALAGEICQTGY